MIYPSCRGTGKGVDAGTIAVYLHYTKRKNFRVFGTDLAAGALQYAPGIFKALVGADLVPANALSCAHANSYLISSFQGITVTGNWGTFDARAAESP